MIKRPTVSANLVAVESLKEGDEILAPWGRDTIETISEAYNVVITKKQRQIPIRRKGRPNMVKRADMYAASRRAARASQTATYVVLINGKRAETIDIGPDQKIKNLRELRRYTYKKYRDSKDDVEVVNETYWNEDDMPPHFSSRRNAEAAIKDDLKLYGKLAYARLAPFFQMIGMSQQKADELARTLEQARDASDAYDKLQKELGSRADFIAKRIGLVDQAPKIPHGYRQTTVDQLKVGDKIITYPHGHDEVTQVSKQHKAVKTKAGQILAGSTPVYVKASRRAARAAQGRQVRVKFKTGALAHRFQQVLKRHYQTESTVSDDGTVSFRMTSAQRVTGLVEELIDDLDGKIIRFSRRAVRASLTPQQASRMDELKLRVIVKSRWASDEDKQVARNELRQRGIAASRRRRTASAALPMIAARIAPILLRYGLTAARAQKIASALQKTSNYAAAIQLLTQELGSGAESVAKAIGLQDTATSRRSVRAADEPESPADFSRLARLLAQHNTHDPRKLPDDAREGFNELVRAIAKETNQPIKKIIGQAMKQAKQYIEDLTAQSSRRRTAKASSRWWEYDFGSGDKAAAFANDLVKSNRSLAKKLYWYDTGEMEAKLTGPEEEQVHSLLRDWLRTNSKSSGINEADRLELYDVITANGPDVDMWSTSFARLVGQAKRAGVLGDPDATYDWLEKKGYFGRRSDNLRGEGDKYYMSRVKRLVGILSRNNAASPNKLKGDERARFWRIAAGRPGLRAARHDIERRRRRAVSLARRATAQAATRRVGYKDSAKLAVLQSFRVSLKVDVREGTYQSAREIAQHIDAALDSAGLQAYDVYVR